MVGDPLSRAAAKPLAIVAWVKEGGILFSVGGLPVSKNHWEGEGTKGYRERI